MCLFVNEVTHSSAGELLEPSAKCRFQQSFRRQSRHWHLALRSAVRAVLFLLAIAMLESLVGVTGAGADSDPWFFIHQPTVTSAVSVPVAEKLAYPAFLRAVADRNVISVSFAKSGDALSALLDLVNGEYLADVRYAHSERSAIYLALLGAGYTVSAEGASRPASNGSSAPWTKIELAVLILFIWLVVPLGLRRAYRRRGLRQIAQLQAASSRAGTASLARTAHHGTSKAAVVRGRDKELEVPTTRFTDVAGMDEAIEELSELVSFLKDGERYLSAGAELPHGYLLVGPPGTGKTLLARAVAGEAAVPFFAMAAAEFVETYVGVGAARVRKLFEQARAAQPAIIFIDELDAMGRERANHSSSGNDERDTTLNQLLVEMDGFVRNQVVVLAATNRPDVLDAALVRPGRFDCQIVVPVPDRRGRERILEIYLRRRSTSSALDVELIARRTPGFTGADLANLVNTAARLAVREGNGTIEPGHLDEAISVVSIGPARKSAVVAERDRRITAWHEAGHALVGLWLEAAIDPVQVTIVPRGQAGGVTWFPAPDEAFLSRRQARSQLAVAMAGRVGEELLLGDDFTQGAAQDFKAATELARAMVTEYGMSSFGPSYVTPDEARFGVVGQAVIAATNELLDEAITSARELLESARPVVERVANALLEEETLDLETLRHLADRGGAVTVPSSECDMSQELSIRCKEDTASSLDPGPRGEQSAIDDRHEPASPS
jgi:cell division protease FtsH